jgi:hypothetical protein
LADSVRLLLQQLEADAGLRELVRVSAIAYSDTSEKVFAEEVASASLWDRITYSAGATDFDKPLRQALELVQGAAGSYDQNHVFFFTDGTAGYPQAALTAWRGNPSLARRTTLRAVAYGPPDNPPDPYILEAMAAEFRVIGAGGTFAEVSNGDELGAALGATFEDLESRAAPFAAPAVGPATQCYPVTCGPREYIQRTGVCAQCPPYERPVPPNNY